MRLYDPHVALLLGLETVEVRVEVGEFVRQNVGVRDDVEGLFAELLLHFDDVFAESILARQLGRHGKVVDLLVLVQTLILILLNALTGPQQVPIVPLCLAKPVRLKHRLDQLGLRLDHLEHQFWLRVLRLKRARLFRVAKHTHSVSI